MKKKLLILALAVGLFLGLAVPSPAATTWHHQKTVSSGNTATINPSGYFTCPVGDSVVVRTYTYDFLWFDSTGSLRMRVRDSGGNIRENWWSNQEFDGVLKYWWTNLRSVDWADARLSNVSSLGTLQLNLGCYDN